MMAFMPEGAMGYDRAITVFSPDGKLYQVEYAERAIEKGATAIGVKVPQGIVLLVEKRFASPLIEPRSYEKIFKIDDHIGTATSGLIGDARILVDKARLDSQIYRLTYSETIRVEELAKRIGDHKQMYTQFGGIRPYGASLLIAGVDDNGPQVYVTHPSGALYEYKAKAIGQNNKAVNDFLEKKYSSVKSLEDAIGLSLKALETSMEDGLTKDNVEMALIKTETSAFEKVADDVIEGYIAAKK
jgi:proteasome alpha subunit